MTDQRLVREPLGLFLRFRQLIWPVPCFRQLQQRYGLTKNQTNIGVIQARVSVLYDVLNHYVLDGVLSTKQIGERVLALKHLVKSKAKYLIIYSNQGLNFKHL